MFKGKAVDSLYMVVTDAAANSGNDDTLQGLAEGRITRGELQRAAGNICRFLLDTPAFACLYQKEIEESMEQER